MTYRVASLVICLTVFALACADKPRSLHERITHGDTLWLFAAIPSDDAIHVTDTEDSLRARFGSENVMSTRVAVGEGDELPGTSVFARDSTLMFEVLWGDSVHHTMPSSVRIAGKSSRWAVYPGVSLGTRLIQLEQMNRRPFLMSGFGWDYSGGVTNLRGGRLDSLWNPLAGVDRRVGLSLDVDQPADVALERQVEGDHEYSSSLPALRTLNPRVWQMWVRPR